MTCPFCIHTKTRVVDKRDLPEVNSIRRRRECLGCGKRFTTYERIELSGITIIKKDGRRESFDRRKLTLGLLKACEKRPVSRQRIDMLVHEIEGELLANADREIPSDSVGSLVVEKLKALDKVAYIRFASVYREFEDVRSFEAALKQLQNGGSHNNTQ